MCGAQVESVRLSSLHSLPQRSHNYQCVNSTGGVSCRTYGFATRLRYRMLTAAHYSPSHHVVRMSIKYPFTQIKVPPYVESHFYIDINGKKSNFECFLVPRGITVPLGTEASCSWAREQEVRGQWRKGCVGVCVCSLTCARCSFHPNALRLFQQYFHIFPWETLPAL